ncbi:MAG: dockerin type I repeat-containing protein, partial [Ruminococcus sp.]
TAYIIFNNGGGTQYPSEVGYEIKEGESKIFNGSGLDDYVVDVPTRLKGDVNNDGFVNINDATCIQKFTAEIKKSDGKPFIDVNNTEDFIASDVNGDSVIDVKDATKIQKMLAA